MRQRKTVRMRGRADCERPAGSVRLVTTARIPIAAARTIAEAKAHGCCRRRDWAEQVRRQPPERPESDRDRGHEPDRRIGRSQLGDEKRQDQARQQHHLGGGADRLCRDAKDRVQRHSSPVGGIVAKLGARHDELAAYRAGHRFHAAEYRSVSAADDWPVAADMRKGDRWARAAIKNRADLGVARRCARAARLSQPAARARARAGFPERARCPQGRPRARVSADRPEPT